MHPRRAPRAVIACLAVLSVLSWAWLPAEHVHAHDENGHHVEYLHRHYQAHTPAAHDDAALDHEEDATYSSGPAAIVSDCGSDRPDFDVVLPVPALQHGPGVAWLIRLVPAAAHDPPWVGASPPRGPPSAA
ncbi:MAG: hypothetical protein AB7O32_18225 [Vicinamibacterales bacterium]